ncbi:peptidase M20 [Mesoterricola silvestris]|uniref:Peptidase M20 n=2 Tax=Mesoterricola silvestris TaxID=2927979 RepID=A0AA48GYA5_9BACT|nr:M20/M25/M40 family metallo-hydrolase [Mesoterricola silvestris]BDU74101.1 peptidase M20 [Mesoterricola silvestris]
MMTPAALLESLVAIPSVSHAEQALADHVAALLGAEGLEVRRTGNSLWFEVGTGGPRILFASHLDTVPPCDGWSSDPFTPSWNGDRLTGLGANDAKGCVTAMILAALELRDLKGARAVFAFTEGEEVGGKGIREVLPDLGPLDAAVVGEPTGLEICAAQRGMLILRCTSRGEAAHVAHSPLGENAIHKAARDIQRLAAMTFEPHALLGETRAQVTQVQGGRARNQVPDACEFFVDLRTTPNLDHQATADRIALELESEVAVHSMRYGAVATDPSEPVVKAALAASGRKAPRGSATASDWAFLAHLPAVKAGPGDTHRSHRPDEWISLAELEAGIRFYAALAREYAREACHV